MKKQLSIMLLLMFVFTNMMNAQDKKIPQKDTSTKAAITATPSPGEILASLGKIGNVKWSQLVVYEKKTSYPDKVTQALNLGVRIALGFVAIHDKDRANFGDMNGAIYSIGNQLGIGAVIQSGNEKLKKLTSKDKWDSLPYFLDETNVKIQHEIQKGLNQDVVLLGSIGGYFEGMFIVSSYFVSNYDAKKVSLLYQKTLTDYYIKEIAKLKPETRNNPVMVLINKKLKEIQSLFKADPKLSLASITSLKKISQETVSSIIK